MSSHIYTHAIAWSVHTFHINTMNTSERISLHVRKGSALLIIGVNLITHNHNGQHTFDSFVYRGFSVCVMDAYSHIGISKSYVMLRWRCLVLMSQSLQHRVTDHCKDQRLREKSKWHEEGRQNIKGSFFLVRQL